MKMFVVAAFGFLVGFVLAFEVVSREWAETFLAISRRDADLVSAYMRKAM